MCDSSSWNLMLLVVVFVLIGCTAVSASPGYYCYKTSHSINIDGRAIESAWKDVPPLALRNMADGSKAKHSTDVKLLWDKKQLYISTVTNNKSDNLRVVLNPLADDVNYIEINIDLHTNGCEVFYGKTNDVNSRKKHQCGSIQFTTQSVGSRQNIELAIPWTLLAKFNSDARIPKSGDVWRVIFSCGDQSYWPVLKTVDMYNLSRSGYLTFSDHSAAYKKIANKGSLEWKMVWLWTMQDKTVAQVVSAAKSLGFNALSATSKEMAEECHRQDIQAFAALWFADAPAKYAQVMRPTEKEARKWDKGPASELYQFGGEPVLGGEIYREGDCWCLDRPEALEYGKAAIDGFVADGYDGVAFDAIGFTNLHACYCPVTQAKQQEFQKAHPELSPQQAVIKYSEQSLLAFYSTLSEYARKKKSDIKLTTHIYPVFAPDPLYGSKLPVDYCGETVAWFFKPHWNLKKVERYSYEVVQGALQDNAVSTGAPFVGVYSLPPNEMHKKTADRVRQELRMIKKSGARALQMAELGNILDDPAVAKVVREELSGDVN